MKIIYYNKNIYIKSHNISAYNLLLKCLDKIKESPKNISNYYLTSLEGHPLKYSIPTKNYKTYYLKRKIKGGSKMKRAGNIGPLCVFVGIIYALLSVFYYNLYIKLILGDVNDTVKARLSAFAVENMKKRAAYPQGGGLAYPQGGGLAYPQSGGLAYPQSGGSAKDKLKCVGDQIQCCLCDAGNWINENLQDKNIGQYFCYTRGVIPTFAIRDDEVTPASIISKIIFYLFIFIVFISLVANGITRGDKTCKKPGGGIVILQLILLILPLVIAIFGKQITANLDKLMKALGKCEIFSNFKLLTCNIILLIFMFFYLGVNKKGISGALVGMMFLSIFIFFVFGYSLDKVLAAGARKIGNMIVVTTPFNEIPGPPSNKIKKASPMDPRYNPIPPASNDEGRKKLPFDKVADCIPRYSIIFNILKTIVLTIYGYGVLSIVIPSQYKAAGC